MYKYKLDTDMFMKLVSVFSGDDQPDTRNGSSPFSDMDLSEIKIVRSANLRSADLSSANLRSADLRSADLRSADLRYADLSSADLSSANLRSADLSSANLRYADLRSADLSSANLRYADLRSADLRYANLSYADLSYAKTNGTEIFSISIPGMSDRGDYLFARVETEGLFFWAGCKQHITADNLREYVRDNDDKSDVSKALYMLAIDTFVKAHELMTAKEEV